MDLEATGIEDGVYLIQLAFVPVDIKKKEIEIGLSREVLVKCPSFEELKPKLNSCVHEHNESLIRQAHKEGLSKENLKDWVVEYLETKEVKGFFNGCKPVFLGKSMSALDIPLLTEYFSRNFMMTRFHHHTIDLTCVARSMVDAGFLPRECAGTTGLLNFFKVRAETKHTALADAIDMADVYLKLIDFIKKNSAYSAASSPKP